MSGLNLTSIFKKINTHAVQKMMVKRKQKEIQLLEKRNWLAKSYNFNNLTKKGREGEIDHQENVAESEDSVNHFQREADSISEIAVEVFSLSTLSLPVEAKAKRGPKHLSKRISSWKQSRCHKSYAKSVTLNQQPTSHLCSKELRWAEAIKHWAIKQSH